MCIRDSIYTEGPQGAGIGIYDPDTDTWSRFTTELTADLSMPALINNGSEVLLVGGKKTVEGKDIAQTAIIRVDTVSYTHLDVYKRQSLCSCRYQTASRP